MYDKDGSGCIDKTELKEIVEVILTDSLIISESSHVCVIHMLIAIWLVVTKQLSHLHTSFCNLTVERPFILTWPLLKLLGRRI